MRTACQYLPYAQILMGTVSVTCFVSPAYCYGFTAVFNCIRTNKMMMMVVVDSLSTPKFGSESVYLMLILRNTLY